MPEFQRPVPYIPGEFKSGEWEKIGPGILQAMLNWTAQQAAADKAQILADKRFTDTRIASGIQVRQFDYSGDKANQGIAGDVLFILPDERHYDWGRAGATSPSGGTPTGLLHNLLSPTHTDTNTQSPSKGSIVAATSTKWDELVVGTDGFVLTADSAQTLGVKWAAAAPASLTRRVYLTADDFTQSNGTTMTFGFSGTYPNRYKSWLFVDAPASGPQAIHAAWRVPKDYVSGGTVKVFYTAEGASDGTYHPQIQYIPIAEVASNAITGQESMRGARTLIEVTTGDLLLATTGGVVQAIYRQATINVGTMTGLVVDDLVLMDLARDSTQDTYPDTIRVVGVAIDYTAST